VANLSIKTTIILQAFPVWAPSYLEIRQLKIKSGHMFTDSDVKRYNKVCVIGKTIADNLFTKGENPVGKIIRFNSIPFQVIGVLESKGYNSMGMGSG